MSTSLLYHAFGIRGYRYVRTAYVQGQTIFTLGQEPHTCRCSACGSADVVSRGHVERRFRCLPIGLRPTVLVLPIPRLQCRACGVVRQDDVSFADPRRSYMTKLFNDKLSELLRSLYHRAEADQNKVLKGARWLLLKNPENLDADKDEKARLEEALALNKPLATAYYLKEDLRRFWEQPGKRFATAFLNDWLKRAEASVVRVLRRMAKTLAAHRSGLLASYDAMITSGPMEGTNNKIKTMKRMAYGFRDKEFFKLKILAIHETKYALVG